MSLKLTDLLEGWYDPPEYDEPSGQSFIWDYLNDIENVFNLIFVDKDSGLFMVNHKETNKKYISHIDNVDYEYYQADTYTQYDRDEDGSYSYEEIDKDNAELTNESYTIFATYAYSEGDIGKDFDEWESGIALIEFSNIILRGFYLNDKVLFNKLIELVKKYTQRNDR